MHVQCLVQENKLVVGRKKQVGHNQGPSVLDPRSGSIFFGGRSISSIYRRSRIDIAGPQIDEISSIYRRYIVDISTIYIVDILNVTFYVSGAGLSKRLEGPMP
jgi:hypothetical protein